MLWRFNHSCGLQEDPAGTVTALTLAPWGVYTLQYPLTRGSLPILGLRLLEGKLCTHAHVTYACWRVSKAVHMHLKTYLDT